MPPGENDEYTGHLSPQNLELRLRKSVKIPSDNYIRLHARLYLSARGICQLDQ